MTQPLEQPFDKPGWWSVFNFPNYEWVLGVVPQRDQAVIVTNEAIYMATPDPDFSFTLRKIHP